MARDVLRLIDDWQPDLLVRDGADFGSLVAAEARNIPHAAGGAMQEVVEAARESLVIGPTG
jgi:hypothetical protein